MRRRDFIKGIAVPTTWPLAARAQQTAKTHRIALVHPSVSIADMSESGANPNYTALFKELRRLGYIEGVNLVVFLGSRQLWSLPSTDVLRKAAQQLGISLLGPPMESPIQGEEYRRILGAMAQQHVDGVIISDQTENVIYRQLIVDSVRAANLPAIFPYREYFEIGALMAYGTFSPDLYPRLATYIDQILKGAHPSDLPIYLTSKFELLINLTTAKALGLSIPSSLLPHADEVIE